MQIEDDVRGSLVFVRIWNMNTDIIGAEVGVFDGINAATILLHMPNVKLLYLIDPYENYHGHTDVPRHKAIGAENVTSFGDRKKWICKKFEECTIEDIDQPLDFIYIDGDHEYDGVKNDIENAVKFVKPGGVVCGHDYNVENLPDVSRAVNDYCKDHSKLLKIWGGEWWFINGG